MARVLKIIRANFGLEPAGLAVLLNTFERFEFLNVACARSTARQ